MTLVLTAPEYLKSIRFFEGINLTKLQRDVLTNNFSALLNWGMNRHPNPPIFWGGTGLFKAPRIGGLGAAKISAFGIIHT